MCCRWSSNTGRVRTVLAEVGVAGNDYGRWGQSGDHPGRGLLAGYRRDGALSVLQLLRLSLISSVPSGGLGVYILTTLPDTDAIATRSSIPSAYGPRAYFGAVFSNTLAVTQKIRAQEGQPSGAIKRWGSG